ncbi:hypothetical protein LCGC14_2375360 [marine sediment metagenome]|uniref:Orn/DAP/Arg decarboxylase 2 N-terminal domain-containing protein n=1 Tax=marine sediment metagenome TaxID=412755 RepID=A0A0F9EEY6_9ZZZZ
MDHFNYRDGELYAENVPVSAIAERFGTPAYVYSRATLERHYKAYDDALNEREGREHLVCYAVKANSNLAVLNVLARLGAGFDIVSAGELERVLRAGGDAGKVVFSGVGKQKWEMYIAHANRALEASHHEELVEALEDIAAHWNGSETQTAMSDACLHNVEIALCAIKAATK